MRSSISAGRSGTTAGAVTTNRELAAKSLGLEPDRVVWMNQVHGADVAVVDGPWGADDIPPVDAIVTTRRGLALAVLTADCVPVLLTDPVAGVAAAAHAGRPGMIAGVVPAAVRAMTGLGADPARIVARTGPAVCGRCYEVPEAMRAEVATVEPQRTPRPVGARPRSMCAPECTHSWSASGCTTGSSRRCARWSRATTSPTVATAPQGDSRDMSGWTDGHDGP